VTTPGKLPGKHFLSVTDRNVIENGYFPSVTDEKFMLRTGYTQDHPAWCQFWLFTGQCKSTADQCKV